MNSKRRPLLTLLSAATLFGAVFSANAQKREMPVKEVDALVGASRRLLLATPNRSTYTEEELAMIGGVPKLKKKVVTEEIPSKSNRTITSAWSSDGKLETNEFVYVDGKTYRRTNDQPWDTSQSDLTTLIAPPLADESFKLLRTTNQAWFIEETSINGRKVSVYETKSTYTYAERKGRVTYVSLIRYWIGADGFMLKRVAENTVLGQPKITRGLFEYEYDNIKIEAPIK